MDDEAFLRAIAEQPDEDGPRLVYADWLEERGDPYSEFIRIQIELAKVQCSDPQYGLDGERVYHDQKYDCKRCEGCLRRKEMRVDRTALGLRQYQLWRTHGTAFVRRLQPFNTAAWQAGSDLGWTYTKTNGCWPVKLQFGRGLPEVASARWQVLIGGVCGTCGGTNRLPGSRCWSCRGQGRVEGHIEDLVDVFPLRYVIVQGKDPAGLPGQAHWTRWDRRADWWSCHSDDIPDAIWDLLHGGEVFGRDSYQRRGLRRVYCSAKAALGALSEACLSYGKLMLARREQEEDGA